MPTYRIVVEIDPSRARRGGRDAETALERLERRAQATGAAISRAMAFAGISVGIAGLVQMADAYTNIQNRLKTVTSGSDELANATSRLLAIANATRQSFATTAQVYSRVASASQQLGLSQEELLDFQLSLNKAVALSGATSTEASNALIQLAQGLGAGALRGDELNSVLEQLPTVADVIAERLGVTRGHLRGLAEDGKITSQIVIEAFKDASSQLDSDFANSVATISQSFQVLQNNVTNSVGEWLAASGAAETLSDTILLLANNLDKLAILTDLAAAAAFVMVGRFAASGIAMAGATLAAGRLAVTTTAVALAQAQMGAAIGPPTAAMVAQQVAAARLAVAQGTLAAAGRGVMALFGGPYGLAVAAATAAIYLLWNESSTASSVIEGLDKSGREAVNSLFDLEEKAREAGINVNSLGNAANDSNPLIRTIAASYGIAADEAKRLAVNARQAAIEVAQGKIAELKAKREDLGYSEFLSNPLGQGGRPTLGPLASFNATVGGALGLSKTVDERFKGIDAINNQIEVYARQIQLLTDLPDAAFEPEPRPDRPAPTSPGGPTQRAKPGVDAIERFNDQLRQDIELAGLSGAAHEKRAAILGLESQIGRQLTDQENESISTKLDLLAATEDLTALTTYSDMMRQETALLALSNREREIASEVMRVQAERGRELTDAEKALVEARARELQQAKDAANLNEFAERLIAEGDALADLKPGHEVRAALLQKELELGRALTPVERERLRDLLEENEALSDQRNVFNLLNQSRDTAIRQMEAIRALRESGEIDDADARLATGSIGLSGELRDQGDQLGGEFALESEMERLQLWTDEQNRIVADGLAARLITEQEAATRSIAIEEERQRRLRELVTAQRLVVVQGAQSIAESLASIARDTLGEQSKAYRAMFVVSKAFAIADGAIKLQQAIANALSLPFPANIPAIAQAAAIGAGIISNIKAVSLQFAEGGLVRGPGTGTSDSIMARVSNGEYVVNARATAQNLGLLESINAGRNPVNLLPRSGGGPVPGASGGGGAAVALNVTVENYSGASIDVQRLSATDVRIIAREEAQNVLKTDLPDTFAAEMSRPNSRAKEAVVATTTARPAR